MSSNSKAVENRALDSVAGLRFLIVDDHKFSRHITIEALKWLNATKVAEAMDAAEAIGMLQGASSLDRNTIASDILAKRLELSDDRLFGQGKFDCVITDFNMQPKNGLHLLKAIRTGEAKCARDTPVLMLTGFSDDYLIASALMLDVNAFVLKPISRMTFHEKLSRVLMRPIEVRSVEAYEAVEVPNCDDLAGCQTEPIDQASDSKDADCELDLSGRDLHTVKLTDIMTNGMPSSELLLGEDLVLGEDLQGPSGAIYIHRGTRLTELLLEKLNELHEMGMMSDDLQVYY